MPNWVVEGDSYVKGLGLFSHPPDPPPPPGPRKKRELVRFGAYLDY